MTRIIPPLVQIGRPEQANQIGIEHAAGQTVRGKTRLDGVGAGAVTVAAESCRGVPESPPMPGLSLSPNPPKEGVGSVF